MARIISKESFGLMAIVLIFIAFIEIFGQIGIGPAIIQRKELTQNQLKSSFYLSLLLSISFFIAVYFLSPIVAEFYNDMRLVDLIRVTALSFIIAGIGIVPKAMLFRKLKFKELFISTMIGMFLGLIVIGLPFAFMGFEVWAIVIYLLSQNLILTICYWYFNPLKLPGKPTLKFAKPLIKYGGGSTLFNFISYLSFKVDIFIVSKFFGDSQSVNQTDWNKTGIYDQSLRVMGYPITIISKLSDSILFSGLSRIQDEKQKLKYAFKTAFTALSVISLPASAFLCIYAREVILIILGDQYLEAIPIVQILFLGLFLRTIIKLCDAVVRALDKVYTGAFIKFIYLILIALFVYIMSSDVSKNLGIYRGLQGVAMGLLLAVSIQFVIMLGTTLKIIELRLKELSKLILGPASLTLCVIALTGSAKYIFQLNHKPVLISLLVGTLLAGLSYFLVIWFIPQAFGKQEHNTISVLLKKLPQKGFIKTLTQRVVDKTF